MKKPGVFDRVKIEYDRHADHIFNAGDIVVDIVRGTGEYRDTGSGGERRTYNILREMFSNHLIFRNVYLTKADGKLTEIDLMAIGKQGLFVIESKNYSGWIFGDSSQRYWTATLPNGQKNRFYSPIFQNASHIKALAEKFGERYPQMEYYSLVVFS
ncbi:MAG: NERD domain-containing protein, partial [Coriobacteriales bacterium]|nr:NERD domain-containing protein [Coriobacteriales bacterium]